MNHPESNKVTATNGPRPAGRPDKCFYCRASIGTDHLPDCVLRKRTVIARASIEVLIEASEAETAESIRFRLNDSSWCAQNVVPYIEAAMNATENGCICDLASFEVVREATKDDEMRHAYKNEDF